MTPAWKDVLRARAPRVYRMIGSLKREFIRTFGYQPFARTLGYDEYWEQKAGSTPGVLSPFRRARAAAVAQLIPAGAMVLDLGCGDCAILAYLREARGVRGVGVDISPRMVEFGRQQGFTVYQRDLARADSLDGLPPVDVVLASEILEHIPEPERLLEACRRLATRVVLSVPNTGYVRYRLRLLAGRVPMQWVRHPGEHLRFWTLADLQWWTDGLGWQLERVVPYMGPGGLRQLWPNLFAEAVVVSITSREGPERQA